MVETVALRELLSRSVETIQVFPEREYRELTVKLWGKGVVLRRLVSGVEVIAPRRLVARAGQFILSRIDARNGAIGIVPRELDGAIISNDFPVFDVNTERLLPEYLGWLCRTAKFVEECRRASEGTTNRVRLKEERFLARHVPLPSVEKQGQVVGRIARLEQWISEAQRVGREATEDATRMLRSAFDSVTNGASESRMADVAPVIRRSVEIFVDSLYPELGIRSFGRGTFHKPALSGAEVGSKRLFRIEPGDLLFNNVFAWEGAVAVARSEDGGRLGSHQFITCVPKEGVTTSEFLCFYFLTTAGLEKLGKASPGGAGRNRTLGLEALARIRVPTPDFEKQVWFTKLLKRAERLQRLQSEAGTETEALMRAILERTFNGARSLH